MMSRRFALSVATVCASVILVLTGWAALREEVPAALSPNGELVTAAGVTEYVQCDGPQDRARPTVVLISGLGAASANAWRTVQPVLAQDTRVCSVDRPGIGLSPDRGDRDNGPVQNAHEILAALAAYGEPGPYVLVGWSYGGIVAMAAAAEAQKGPGVSGVVLVDGSLPDEYRTVDTTGWEESGQPLDMAAAEPVISRLQLGDVPVVVLEAGRQPYDVETIAEMREKDEQLAAKSDNYVYAEVPDSGHFIARENPQAVVAAVREVLAATPADKTMPPCPPEFSAAGMVCLAGG